MRKIIPIVLLMLLIPVLCYGQGAVVFGRSDPCQNFIRNSRFGLFTRSGLAQGTTGRQTDYETGSAIRDDDPDDADSSSDYTVGDCVITRTNSAGNGAGGDDYFYTLDRDNPGAATQTAYVALSGLVVGHDYKFACYVKDGTDAISAACQLQVLNNARTATLNYTSLAASAAWADFSVMWRATETNNTIRFYFDIDAADETVLIDEIYVVEVTPGCVAADAYACDWWTKDTTLDVLRTPNGTNTQNGTYYGLTCKPSAANDFIYYPQASIRTQPFWYEQFQGKPVAAGVWCKTSTASHAFLQIIDSDTTDYDQTSDSSQYHSGGGTFEWLEKSITVSSTTTELSVALVFDQAAGTTYFSQPVLIYGSVIGEGRYAPPPNEMLYFENDIASHKWDTLAAQSTGSGIIYVGGDSSAVIPYGAKAVRIKTACNDSGSAAGTCSLALGYDISEVAAEVWCSPQGLANDTIARSVGWASCNANGNIEYSLTASGAGLFDVVDFEYVGVQY